MPAARRLAAATRLVCLARFSTTACTGLSSRSPPLPTYIATPTPRSDATCWAGLCAFHTPSRGQTGGPKTVSAPIVGTPDAGLSAVSTTATRCAWSSRSSPPEKLPRWPNSSGRCSA